MLRATNTAASRRGALLQTHADAAALSAPADVVLLDARRLAQCLAALPERARTLLLLTFYAGQSAPEVARELQMSPENVRVLRHRTIGRMRACMEGSSAA
ncbi:MAG: sigma-70 family RNA polymerase sigma factor [Nannocystaceae bacterium]